MKFRVWDAEKERFLEPVHEKGRTEDFFLSPNGLLFIYKQNGNFTQLRETKEYEIDKWTGLKDMHGREIYENDIVVWGHHCPECRENPIRVAVVRMNPDIQFYEVRMDKVFEYGCFAYKDTSHLEVVGNVRESLLEVIRDTEEFLNKVFRPLDRFLIFPKSEKGRVKGTLLYEGENFVAYGYGNGKSASPFYDKAIPLSMEVFKRLLQINFPFQLLNATHITYSTTKGKKVILQKVEDPRNLSEDLTLLEVAMLIRNMGSVIYTMPYFRIASWMGDRVRRHGLARFFLKILDKVWRVET